MQSSSPGECPPHLLVMRWLVVLIFSSVGWQPLGCATCRPPGFCTPLDLTVAPNVLTGLKLQWMRLRPEACFAAFAGSGIALTRVSARASEVGCEIEDAVRLPAIARTIPSNSSVTCPLAAAWVLFERNTLQSEATRHLGSEVSAIRHFGTFACRNINHAVNGPRSQHATAGAIDIAGFVLRDGREVRLDPGWFRTGPEAVFLRDVRGRCLPMVSCRSRSRFQRGAPRSFPFRHRNVAYLPLMRCRCRNQRCWMMG